MNNETNRLAQLIANSADKELGTRVATDGQPRRQDKAAAQAIEAEYLFIRREEGGVLDKALQSLREANPDPAVVEALAAKTTNERNNPHTLQSVFTPPIHTVPNYLTCLLCGVTISNGSSYAGPPISSANKHPASVHVNWHNQLHRAGIDAA